MKFINDGDGWIEFFVGIKCVFDINFCKWFVWVGVVWCIFNSSLYFDGDILINYIV